MLRSVLPLCSIVLAVTEAAVGQPRCDGVGPSEIYTCVHPGEGPTVILAAGAGQDSRTWRPVVGELNALGRVVTFDRPGFGESPDAEGPRTPTAIARELHGVLTHLDISGPLVLVGHSMGGVHLLRYADLYPDDVAGVVLLDTPPPRFEEERLTLLTEAERERRSSALAAGRSRARPVVGHERDGAAAEAWAFADFPAERPLFVVVADQQDFGDLGSEEAHRTLWVERSSEWLVLSRASELVIAEGSGHMVHHDRAQLVVDVIGRLLNGLK